MKIKVSSNMTDYSNSSKVKAFFSTVEAERETVSKREKAGNSSNSNHSKHSCRPKHNSFPKVSEVKRECTRTNEP